MLIGTNYYMWPIKHNASGQNPVISSEDLIVKLLQDFFFTATANVATAILWHMYVTTRYSLAETKKHVVLQ